MGIVFSSEFAENNATLAQEKQTLKCPELGDSNSLKELKELRNCLGKIKIDKNNGRKMRNVQRSYEGSLELVKHINLLKKNKTLKHFLREESLNNNSNNQ